MIYTVAAFVVQFKTGTELSPTLTTSYFAFWGVEIVNLALIKHGKVKGQNRASSTQETVNNDAEGIPDAAQESEV